MAVAYKYDFEINKNYILSTNRPFDARTVVKTKADLEDVNTWKSKAGKFNGYKGMIVSVYEDITEENNGLYILKNFTRDPVTNLAATLTWIKIGSSNSNSSVGCQVVTSLETITNPQEGTLAYATDVGEFYVRVGDQWKEIKGEGGAVQVESYANLPQPGNPTLVYVVKDAGTMYNWIVDAEQTNGGYYLLVGMGNITVINGGTADERFSN